MSQHGESAMLERVDFVPSTMAGAVAFTEQGKDYDLYPKFALLYSQLSCAAST